MVDSNPTSPVPETCSVDSQTDNTSYLTKTGSWAPSDPDSESMSAANSYRSESPEIDHSSLASSKSSLDDTDLDTVRPSVDNNESVLPIFAESSEYFPRFGNKRLVDESMTATVHDKLFRQHACVSCSEVYQNHTAWVQHEIAVHQYEDSCSCKVEGCRYSHNSKDRETSTTLDNIGVKEKVATLKAFLDMPTLDESDGKSIALRFLQGKDIGAQLIRTRGVLIAGLGKRGFRILMSLLNARKTHLPKIADTVPPRDDLSFLELTPWDWYLKSFLPGRFSAMTISTPAGHSQPCQTSTSSQLGGVPRPSTQAHGAVVKKNSNNQGRKGKKRKMDTKNDGDDSGDDEDDKPRIFPCPLHFGDSLCISFCKVRFFTNLRAVIRHCADVHEIWFCKDCWERFGSEQKLELHRRPQNPRNDPACPNPVCLNPVCPLWYQRPGDDPCRCSERSGHWGPWEKLCIVYESVVVGRALPLGLSNARHTERMSLRGLDTMERPLNSSEQEGIGRWPLTIAPENSISRYLRGNRQLFLDSIQQWLFQRCLAADETQGPTEHSWAIPTAAAYAASDSLRALVAPTEYLLSSLQDGQPAQSLSTQTARPVVSPATLNWYSPNADPDDHAFPSLQAPPSEQTASSDPAGMQPTFSYPQPSIDTAFTSASGGSQMRGQHDLGRKVSPSSLDEMEKRLEKKFEQKLQATQSTMAKKIEELESMVNFLTPVSMAGLGFPDEHLSGPSGGQTYADHAPGPS